METKEKEPDSFEANELQKVPGWNAKLHATKQFVWNPSSREFMGRTALSWAKIGVFYLVFYAILAAFFAIMLVGFFRTLDPDAPTQQNMYSLMKSNPGMAFRPMASIESTLIKFKQGVRDDYKPYMTTLNEFLDDYYDQLEDNTVNCTDLPGNETLEDGKVCRVDRSNFGNVCTSVRDYSFDEGRPCILLKINKVYGWKPRPFSDEELKNPGNSLAQEANKKLGDRLSSDHIGVTCEGENEADNDNMGNITYYPKHGFPAVFYPYKKQKNYRPPIVFVRFDNPKAGVLIQVWCRLWSANIKHHKNDKAGSIHFELLID